MLSSNLGGSDVVITGSGFSASVEDVTVKIKNADCTVIAASETEITCTPSLQTPAGNRKINVYIAGKGKAALADGTSCRFFSTLKPIVSVTPSSCSVGGRNKYYCHADEVDLHFKKKSDVVRYLLIVQSWKIYLTKVP